MPFYVYYYSYHWWDVAPEPAQPGRTRVREYELLEVLLEVAAHTYTARAMTRPGAAEAGRG